MERELDLVLEIVIPTHGLFFRPIGIHDDFLGDAIFPVVISSRFGAVRYCWQASSVAKSD